MRTLIVVDMLNDFCHPDGVLSISPVTGELYAESIIEPIAEKIEEYKNNGWDMIWLCDAHEKDDPEFERFPEHAVKGTWGAQAIEQLSLIGYEKVEKHRYSGFYDTDLEQVLREFDPDEVEVVGVCTSICVMDTVGGLANRDYRIVVPRNCVADFDPISHEFALDRMKSLYGAQID